jgi:dinuclear metal center YbgI/SA1388 family protein
MSILLAQLVEYLDAQLHCADFAEDRALNGLQVEGQARVHRVAFAVDACLASIRAAAEAGAQLLVVHHGLFWGQTIPVVGVHRRRLEALLASGISLYAAHLPLDAHEELGNNIGLAQAVGVQPEGPLSGRGWRARPVGMIGSLPECLPTAELGRRVEQALSGPVRVWANRESVGRVAIVSGDATSAFGHVVAAGVDGLICGELGHASYHLAAEAGLAVWLGGHYATETFGLRALARRLHEELLLETVWLDIPTGL